MWAALRSRALPISSSSSSSSSVLQPWKLGFRGFDHTLSSAVVDSSIVTTTTTTAANNSMLLNLQEIETVLSDVKADNVKVISVREHCDWTDFMVIATGRSTWHVKNIAQALIYKAKQKQKGAKRLLLPSVEGQEGGKWVVIDSGPVIVHALDEKARAYYNLESHWTTKTSPNEPNQDLEKALVKIRPKNNSKKPAQKSA